MKGVQFSFWFSHLYDFEFCSGMFLSNCSRHGVFENQLSVQCSRVRKNINLKYVDFLKKTVVQLRKNPVGKLDIAQIPAQMLPNSCCRQAKICWLFFKDFS